MNEQPSIPFKFLVPVMTAERYAHETGLRQLQVRGQTDRNNIPTIKIGGLRLINIVQTAWEMWETNGAINLSVAQMHHSRFCELSGMKENAALHQIAHGNLPSQSVGRLRMVDIAELYRICAENDGTQCDINELRN